MMNWTEGKLARHSRRKGWNAHAAKEKQHFANAARQKAHKAKNDTSQLNFVPSYMSPPSLQNHRQAYSETVNWSRSLGANETSPRFVSLPSVNEGQEPQKDSNLGLHGGQLDDTNIDKNFHRSSGSLNLANKKRALLAKTDWMGINLQKSLSLGEPPSLRSPERPSMSYRRRVRTSQLRQLGSRGNPLNKSNQGSNLANRNHGIRLQIGSQAGAWSINGNTIRSCSGRQKTRSVSGTEEALCRSYQIADPMPWSLSTMSLNALERSPDDLATASLAAHPATPPEEMQSDEQSYAAFRNPSQLWHTMISTPKLQHPRPCRRVNLSFILSNANSMDAADIFTDSQPENRCGQATHTPEGEKTSAAGRSELVKERPPTPTIAPSTSDSMETQPSHTAETEERTTVVSRHTTQQSLEQLSTAATSGAAASTSDSTQAQASQEQQCSSDIRFRQPRLFVGRRINECLSQAVTPVIPSGQSKGRSKKVKRATGRPDIRALPSFDEDPIEE